MRVEASHRDGRKLAVDQPSVPALPPAPRPLSAPRHRRAEKNTSLPAQARIRSGIVSNSYIGASLTLLSNSRPRATRAGEIAARVIFRTMLRKAFPGDSDNETAIKAERVLGLDQRHIRRLLNLEHDAKFRDALAVMAILGFEAALPFLMRKDDR